MSAQEDGTPLTIVAVTYSLYRAVLILTTGPLVPGKSFCAGCIFSESEAGGARDGAGASTVGAPVGVRVMLMVLVSGAR